MKKKLNVGDVVYIVQEHLYNEKGHRHIGVLKEFCVYKAVVKSFYKGHYIDFKAVIVEPHIANNVVHCKLSCLDKNTAFRNVRNAALFAKKLTENWESSILYEISNDLPLRRTWEKYLKEEERIN